MAKRRFLNAGHRLSVALHLLCCLRTLDSIKKCNPKDLKAFPRERWGAFQGGGRVDRIIRYCIAEHNDPKETYRRFEQVRIADASYLSRRIKFLLVLASASPLIGLLGTVIGMLQTFNGLSMQDSYKMDLVAVVFHKH